MLPAGYESAPHPVWAQLGVATWGPTTLAL